MSDVARILQATLKNTAKSPYIEHPISVANELTLAGVTDTDVIIAALLHDTIEDTDTTSEEISNLFGNNVKNIVLECTDDKSMNKVARKMYQISHAEKISLEAKHVKLADKLDNLAGLMTDPPNSWSKEIILGYVVWSFYVCAGLRGACKFLEDKLDSIFKEFGIFKMTESQRLAELNSYYLLLNNK